MRLVLLGFAFMPRVPVALCVLGLLTGIVNLSHAETPEGAALHPSDAPLKQEFVTLIEAQLAAFRADDYRKAYSFAAAEIRGMFQVEAFKTMVKRGYPLIAGSRSANFGLAFDSGNEAVVNVRIEGPDQKSVEYKYLLKKEGTTWRIGGVSEVKTPPLSV